MDKIKDLIDVIQDRERYIGTVFSVRRITVKRLKRMFPEISNGDYVINYTKKKIFKIIYIGNNICWYEYCNGIL